MHNIFWYIYISPVHVSCIHLPSSGENLRSLCVTLICHSVWVASGLRLYSTQTADQKPHLQSDKYQWLIDTAIFSWWWARGCLENVQKGKKINILNRIVHLVWLIHESSSEPWMKLKFIENNLSFFTSKHSSL